MKNNIRNTSVAVGSILIVFLTFNIIDHRHILPRTLIFPSINSISNKFVEAVVTDNKELALELTNNKTACKDNMIKTIEMYTEYHDVKIEDMLLDVYYYEAMPSKEQIRLLLSFKNEDGNIDGTNVILISTYSLIGKRYTCGTIFPNG